MIRKRRAAVLIFCLATAAAAAVQSLSPLSPADGRRMESALERMAKSGPRSGPLQRLDFTENELNAYIALRIARSKEDILRDLRFKVYEENRLEGWMDLDFSAHRIPSWIKKRMSLYFEGTVTVRDGRARFDFRKIFLEKEAVPVMLLDMIIFVASELGKTDAKGVTDWHDLPYGIKDILTSKGRFALLY